MAKTRSTKRALLMSALSLLLCVSMLIGTTFAWFTDSVTSGRNVIQSGNLDVTLDYYNVQSKKFEPVDENVKLFNDAALWEPGYTEVAYLKVDNAGSLALKYKLAVNVYNELDGINKAGETFSLSDHLVFKVVEIDEAKVGTYTRESAWAAAGKELGLNTFESDEIALKADDPADYVALIVYMPTTVGNEANHKTGTTPPQIEMGVTLIATQYAYEQDSFGPDYDAHAAWLGGVETNWYFDDPTAATFTIKNAEELAGLAAIVNGTATAPTTTFAAGSAATVQDSFKGKTIYLGADINLNDVAWTPIGDNEHPFLGNFDGKDHTISNLKVDNEGWAGLIGHAGKGNPVTIKDVNLYGVTIDSCRMAGALVGQLYGNIEDCHAAKVNVRVVPNKSGNSYDNGDKVGGLVGWLGDNNNNHKISNCSVEDVQLAAYRDVGGIAGYVAYSTTIENCKSTNVNIIVDQTTNHYGKKDFNCGPIWGRNSVSDSGVGVIDINNSYDGYSANVTYLDGGIKYKKDGATGDVMLYLVPAEYTETTVVIPEGVDTIGGYAFAYNDNVEKIVLPSTVKTLKDRAFRETSASEVVLNEGLTNISYQAFRNALNVETVVIPSSVTTISKEAFQNSGVKSLTVPATVTSIEYGAMRDMKQLVSVTLEGNADIPVYAFRACTNLKTVVLKGDNVTFGGGSRGMIFTNKENGDGSAITVYVANETVKDRLLAADTAAKDYGGYKIVVMNETMQEVSTGLYKDTDQADTYYVSGADGLAALNEMMSKKTAGKDVIVNLLSDVDMTGKTWTPVDSHADSAFTIKEINGNGFTVSNLTVNGQAMFTRFAGSGDVKVRDIAFEKATVNSTSLNSAILTVQSYQNVLLDNVDVRNSSITGAYKVAPLIATVYNESATTVTATLKNCDVEKVTVKATSYDFCTAGMVAFVYADDNDKIVFENCTVTDVKLLAISGGYHAHAAVYTTGSDSLFNEAAGVTVTNVTFENI